jgi:DNA-binding NtrC family response regulator
MGQPVRAPTTTAPRGPLRWRAPRAWRALLAPREPRAALLALVPGDPLELRVLVAERLAARDFVADAALVVVRAAARIAAALRPGSDRSGGSAGLRIGPAWLVAIVDDVLVDDGPASAVPAACTSDPGRAGTRSADLRRCAVEHLVERAFRRRALMERRAVLAVLLERDELELVAQRAQVDVSTLARRVRATLGALARAVAPAAPCRCYRAVPADSGADSVFLAALASELAPDARRALAALRVLHATRRGPHTSFDVAHVERELAEHERVRRVAAWRAQLAHALNRALPADSYLDYSVRERSAHDAQRERQERGAALGARGIVCDPFTPPLAAAQQLVAGLRAAVDERSAGQVTPHELELWQARLEHASATPRALAAALIEVARRAADSRDMRTAVAAARDGVAALLDAGAPGAALEVARTFGLECDPLVRVAHTALAGPLVDTPVGQEPLLEPRRRPRAAERRGVGRRDAVGRGPHVRAREPRSAAAFGATVLCVVRSLGGACEVVHLDVAPECEVVAVPGAVPTAEEPEVVQLDPGARRVLARWIRDAAGMARGWVQLELRHGLPLDPRCLAALAAAWELAVVSLPRAITRTAEDTPRPVARHAPLRRDASAVEEGPVAAAARELVARLGVGTAQRRWSLFVADVRLAGESLAGAPLHAADQGSADLDELLRARVSGRAPARGGSCWSRLAHGGGARLGERTLRASGALQRALLDDEPVDIGVDPSRLAAHVSAQSGVVLGATSPLGARYVLALESARREPFAPMDVSAWQRVLAAEALRLDLARRSAACAAVGEGEVALPSDEPGALHLARQVAAAAASGAVVALVGPPGVGRRSLACQLHVEARRAGRVVQIVVGAARVTYGERARDGGQGVAELGMAELGIEAPGMTQVATGDTAVLVGVERLDAAGQLALAARIAGAATRRVGESEAHAGLACVLPAAPRVLAARGQLVPELAARLSPWSFVLPPLCEVRHRVPNIMAALLQRVARRRAGPPRALADGALALLWRGTWPCNMLDLSAVAERIGGDGGPPGSPPCTQAEVAAAVAAVGLEPVTRLASREPRASDVAAAVWCTRTAGGRINKARAAAWLGWDADTLAARLVDLGFTDLEVAARALSREAGRDPSAQRETGPLTFHEEVHPPSEAPPGAGGRRGSNGSKSV